MASKGPRSKLDHESRAKRQKALEPPKEPQRPRTHWDHLIEEMVWLSKDFESERKWKLALAKKIAIRASKGMVDQATREERKAKEEELRMKKVALNISKDVKKFWTKIEKLVLYKHRLELDQKKKKALDKQLEFLLGQTERYSTMLAENLVDSSPRQHVPASSVQELPAIEYKDQTDANGCTKPNVESQSNILETDKDYKSEDEPEDDEHTIEEDEALITQDERQEELAALQNEADLPLEELLNRYAVAEASTDNTLEKTEDVAELNQARKDVSQCNGNETSDDKSRKESHHFAESNGGLLSFSSQKHHLEIKEHYVRKRKRLQQGQKRYLELNLNDENEDGDYILTNGDDKDDETTMLEEEELAKAESDDSVDEIALLQNESEIPIEELLARYRQDPDTNDSESESENVSDSSRQKETEEKEVEIESDVQHVSVDEVEIHSEKEDKQDHVVDEGGDRIADAAAAARSAQPTGNTFSTTKVRTKHPFLLKFSLREYQHIGLDWLVTMYEKRLNGILADEMGLGKTIMTIALLAHLACEKGLWGPHLIVVPTSVMLNWETEFLKWCPAFKILTYFGSAKERKHKRQGWMKQNSFHVCITTYRLVIQDSKIFKRKKWKYLILDEAHLIKNWKSQRWQTLLNFNSKRRILLTGTPLQNDLMELWSLMHFLMPHIFQSHQEFKDWFSNPISGMVEGQEKVNKEVVDRLHNVLRPFILRRLKRDVEKQLPGKHEHVIYCRLSRRQRNLYEDFIASSETQATLASSNFFGMISVIMQLRKVCNHPDLFEGRPIISSFDMNGIEIQFCSSVCSILNTGPFSTVDLCGLGFVFTHLDFDMTSWESDEVKAIETPSRLIEKRVEEIGNEIKFGKNPKGFNIFEEIQKALHEERLKEMKERAESIAWWNSLRCKKKPVYSTGLRDMVSFQKPILSSSKFADLVLSPVDRFEKMVDQVESFMFAIPAARAPQPVGWCSKSGTSVFVDQTYKSNCSNLLSPLLTPIRPAIVRRQVYFPDRRLIQFDCGKLQELAVLLRRLKYEGHRALIFTQMTKMLDVLEAFINIYGYTYMRLDGSTQPEERQTLMQRFNTNPKYFLFILSTRSGGVGINLVGADTVIFYDSDWNPAMDQQAQDRCHRIGQTREVHIYRLISESTIEENILKKAKQKRVLDDLVIQSGEYNTEFFKKLDPMELFSGHEKVSVSNMQKDKGLTNAVDVEQPVSNADVEAALKHAEDEADYMALKKVEQEEAVDNQEFTEDAVVKLEDDELLNEEDGTLHVEENPQTPKCVDPNEEKGVDLVRVDDDDDVDMTDDVKQMATVSGNEILTFESQLRPIDRYAVRFLELWDPIVDNKLLETQEQFEQTEWELDHIEKLKEDMEAEVDDDEEPIVYERWDSEFATKVYQEQVKALAEIKLIEDREMEAREKEKKELAEYESTKNETVVKKSKSKKKAKKAKFKSLKKEAFSSETKTTNIKSPYEVDDYDDDDDLDEEIIFVKKRKKPVEDVEVKVSKKSKKLKKIPEPSTLELDSNYSVPGPHGEPPKDLKLSGSNDNREVDHKPQINRSKTGIKISITSMPVKRVMTIRLEKLKKGSIWPNDCCPVPDSWLPSEDAVLCAIVHEYGVNWSLASDVLYGMTAGGFYRGIVRHPVHCCERYRELVQKHVLSTFDNNIHNEKSSGKALLRVSEEHAKMLLDIVSEQPDQAYTLQQHFCHLLTSVWRSTTRYGQRKSLLPLRSGIFHNTGLNHTSRDSIKPQSQKMDFTNLSPMSRLVADALDGSRNIQKEDRVSSVSERHNSRGVGELAVSLEFPSGRADAQSVSLPPVILSITDMEPVPSEHVPVGGSNHFRSSKDTVECRFRDASRIAVEGSLALPPSSIPIIDAKSRQPTKSQLSGKHKLSKSETPSKHYKSKSRKPVVDLNDPNLQSPSTIPSDLSSRFEIEASIPDVGIDDFLILESGYEGFDTVPHNYDMDFISGLEDCLEFSDIG